MASYVNVTFVDAFGRTTSKRFESEAATVANAQSYADAFLAAFADVSDLGHVKAVFEVPLTITPVGAVALSNIDTGATLHAVLASTKGYGMKIPGFKLSLVGSGGAIDVENSDVAAYTAMFLAAGHWNVSEGEHIVSVASGELDK